MENLVFTTFSLMGAFFILKYGSILNKVRDWLREEFPFTKELFSCGLCMGFWLGVVTWILTGYPFTVIFYSSAVCWLGDYLIQFIQRELYGNKKDNGLEDL